MSVVDDQGRIFGRFNVVDLAVAVFVLGIIPLGYGAYVLFKTPPPRLTAVVPAQIQQSKYMRVTIRGENLRPYMRVSFNQYQGQSFLFSNPTEAQVEADLPPGEYDVVLYDVAQERSRLAKGLVVTPPALPVTSLDVVGFLTGVRESQVGQYRRGIALPVLGAVMAVGKPGPDMVRVAAGDRVVEVRIEKTVSLPMLVRVPCSVQVRADGMGECIAGPALGPNVYLMMPAPEGRLPFLITEVRPPTEPTVIDLRVRLTGEPASRALLKPGDLDVGVAQNELANGATVVAGPSDGYATFRVPAYRGLAGWMYAGQSLKVGLPLLFRTNQYQVTGTIVAVPPMPATPPTP